MTRNTSTLSDRLRGLITWGRIACLVGLWLASGCASTTMSGQSPDDRYKLVSDAMEKLDGQGRVSRVRWSADGESVSFISSDRRYRFNLVSRQLEAIESEDAPEGDGRPTSRPATRPQPARGRQRDREVSPDGKWAAVCKDWNVVLEPLEQPAATQPAPVEPGAAEPTTQTAESQPAAEAIAVTTDGQRKFRYGTASWVYGEELDQREAMWWAPDSSKLVFYEFDERAVPDHYLTGGLTDLHTTVLTEGYPKPGEPNPIANLLIYDLATGQTTRVEPAETTEWYTYAVQFRPDGAELLFNRTNRRQNVLHVMAADLTTGATRTILTETQETWQDNAPTMRFLKDGVRFIWATERTGWRQFELWDVEGERICTLTTGDDPVSAIEEIDEDAGVLYYTAFSDECPLNRQLHRVNLDGSGQIRLTREPLNHTIRMSPDRKWFITEYEAIDTPPTTALYSTAGDGERIATLAQADLTQFHELGLEMPELITYKADDGVTDLYGVLHRPSNFRASRKYPLVIDVYGGPLSQGVRNRFSAARAACEYGFLIAAFDNRGTTNRGKAFESAAYLRLGDVDLKDQADGVRHLALRPYVNGNRVGIYGHSYGGYMAALALLKYPGVFHAAVAGGTVSDWRNYDTIYTERFMRTPQENEAGYDTGSCLKYAKQLDGKLLLLHGMVDDNVHPTNLWQLAEALQEADKRFEMMLYPNAGHGLGGASSRARWEFLREHLLGWSPADN